ncbi:MAG: CpXC domain-containing protein, partial [Roseiflexaceae bacterium]
MSLSYSENVTLTCPTCGQGFAAEVWMLVDAAERPDLAEALREGVLNVVGCPHCGNRSPAGAPLLFHDGTSRRVYFAAQPSVAEHELREQAQSLLYRLVGGIPEEQRHPYLGDVQVEQEIEGVRRA